MSPPNFLLPPAYSLSHRWGLDKKLWHCTSTAQQEPKLLQTVLATKVKHGTMQASVKEVNCVPGRHSTTHHEEMYTFLAGNCEEVHQLS